MRCVKGAARPGGAEPFCWKCVDGYSTAALITFLEVCGLLLSFSKRLFLDLCLLADTRIEHADGGLPLYRQRGSKHEMSTRHFFVQDEQFSQRLSAHQISGATIERGRRCTYHYPDWKPEDPSGRIRGLQLHATALRSGSIVDLRKQLQAASWPYKHHLQ
jgi:hypothetical protein